MPRHDPPRRSRVRPFREGLAFGPGPGVLVRLTTALVPALLAALVACGGDGPAGPNGGNDGGGGGDPAQTEEVLLEVPQWAANHNGGGLAFDGSGFLYLALGDGGGAGDDQDNAQDPTNLLGSVLRLEVLDSDPFYRAPAGNPFTGSGDDRRDEIFAFGFRNPWRLSVDPGTDEIWVGDVGQNEWEEIDVVELGGNYGWDCREGAHDFGGSSSPACDQVDPGDFIEPTWEYALTGSRSAVTGGYVYRGSALSDLVGKYVYADFGSGEVWALDPSGQSPVAELLLNAGFLVSSFGVDATGEIYAIQWVSDGKLHRLEGDGAGGYDLVDAFPQLTFDNAVDLRHAGDGSGRLFVVEQGGTIRAFDSGSPDESSVYLDLTDRVTSGGERGLLGLAFHPDFASNGHFYVYYTHTTTEGELVGRLSRFTGE